MKKRKQFAALCLLLAFAACGLFALRAPAGAAEIQTGDVIAFGRYPQTHVEDAGLVEALEAAGAAVEWRSLGYNVTGLSEDFAFYKDVPLDGALYRAVLFTMYRSIYGGGVETSDRGPTGYANNTVHWFRFEPIEWTVLDAESGLVVANAVLDAQAINDRAYDDDRQGEYADPEHLYYLSDYAHGTIRTWLNGFFTATAFSAEEAAVIETKTQQNGADGTGYEASFEDYTFEDTADPVFLLSYAEARNAALFSGNAARIRYGTDYARAQGLYNYGASNGDFWFLRTPGHHRKQGNVNPSGGVYLDVDSNGNDVGICPALYLSLADYERLSAADTPGSAYADLRFDYENGVLTVSGTGAVPTAAEPGDSPLATYAAECRALVLAPGVTAVESGAFAGFDALETLILNGPVSLESGAFVQNGALRLIVCADSAETATDAFPAAVSFYEPESAPHTGALPAGCAALPYSFADGTLYIRGAVTADAYELLDLMTVMCGYFDGIRAVRFDAYTSEDVPVYLYHAANGTYVRAEDDTLTDVTFTVKIEGENGPEAVTFNELCALAAAQELGAFRLAAETDAGEEVKETVFQIFLDRIETAARHALKWIVSLLNYLFSVLSRFK